MSENAVFISCGGSGDGSQQAGRTATVTAYSLHTMKMRW